MGELEPAQQKEFHQVPQAELEPHSAEQDLEEDVGRDFDEIKGGSSSFVEGAIAVLTAKDGIAEIGGAFKASSVVRLAVRASHSTLSADAV